jgi:hypothetical protein
MHEITICLNSFQEVTPNFSEEDLDTLMRNEFINAYDFCAGPYLEDCYDYACSEIRSAVFSGECKKGGRQNRSGGLSLKQCALSNLPKCADEAERVVEKCMASADGNLPGWPDLTVERWAGFDGR